MKDYYFNEVLNKIKVLKKKKKCNFNHFKKKRCAGQIKREETLMITLKNRRDTTDQQKVA